MLNILIHSKNRAAQCDLTLRSIIKYVNVEYRLFVQYGCDEEFSKGYELLVEKSSAKVDFIHESNFHDSFVQWFNSLDDKDDVLLLPDDEIFISELSNYKLSDNEIFSLRLNPRVNYCYPAVEKDRIMKVPVFAITEDRYYWDWMKYFPHTDWGYPHNDDNIFKVKYLREVISGGVYKEPNGLEVWMNNHRRNVRIFCTDKSKIVIIPANRVHGNTPVQKNSISLLDCESLFLSGKRIVMPEIKDNTACQVEVTYQWTR